MPTTTYVKGKDGVIKTGATPTAWANIQSWSITRSAEVNQPWSMGDVAKRAYSTVYDWAFSGEVLYDPADEHANIAVGATVAIEVYPDGEGTGKAYFSGNIVISSLEESADKNGEVMLKIEGTGDGALNEQTDT